MPLPHLMAVLNVTPDSFSDGGRWTKVKDAVAHGLRLARQGAHCIDVGGESTRPGAAPVAPEEQIRRVVPVIEGLRAALDGAGLNQVDISVDTTRAQVAQAALQAGAGLVNDVSAGLDDPGLLPLAAKHDARICLMHRQGPSSTMQDAPAYDDVVAEVKAFLLARATAAEEAGINRKKIWLDPGLGFGKTLDHNLALMKALPAFVATGYPILIGASRKRWIAEVTVRAHRGAAEPDDRLGGSIAATLWAAKAGVGMARVHEIGPHLQALAALAAIQGTEMP